jgi:hypothetical protein
LKWRQIWRFILNESKTTVTKIFHTQAKISYSGDLLQYLGFTFDGQNILIRPSSLKRFYSKMKASIRIAVRADANAGYPPTEIRRRTLVGRYTHWGDRKNFIQYAYRAAKEMDSPQIRKQVRRHTKIFYNHFQKCLARYYK